MRHLACVLRHRGRIFKDGKKQEILEQTQIDGKSYGDTTNTEGIIESDISSPPHLLLGIVCGDVVGDIGISRSK